MPDRLFSLKERTRLIVLGVTVVTILILINVEIAGKEQILRDGTTMLLRIAPRDPRSLLQGDYMALRYTLAERVNHEAEQAGDGDGVVVIRLDEFGVARFVSLYREQPLQEGQYLLRYRKRGDSVRLASDAFFFEEGTWQEYSAARFGEIRVDSSGDAVLIGLRDADRERLGTALH